MEWNAAKLLVGRVWMDSTCCLLPSATGSNRRSLSMGGRRTHRHSQLSPGRAALAVSLGLSLRLRSEPVVHACRCPFSVQGVGGWHRRQTIMQSNGGLNSESFDRFSAYDWMDGGRRMVSDMHACMHAVRPMCCCLPLPLPARPS
jgi:hypothetical protein